MNPARKEPDLSTYSGRLAKRIRMLRDKVGFSVEDVVRRMQRFGFEIKPVTYRSWEGHRSRPDWDALPALAKALRVKPRDLIPAK